MHPSWLLTFLQIILESLPISSSTHISFFASQFSLPFEVALDHAAHGITLVILLLFWQDKIKKIFLSGWRTILQYGLFIIIATILPTLFFFLNIKQLTSTIHPFFGIVVTAVLLFVTRTCSIQTKKISSLQAIALGCAQSLALLPGISRMGITYSVGRFMHHSPQDALWLSCLIELPICCGGVLLALKKYHQIMPLIDDPFCIMLGVIVSIFVSYVGLFVTYCILTKNQPWIFSLYLLIVAFLAL